MTQNHLTLTHEREAWLSKNSEARKSFYRGLKEAEQGQGKEMDFSEYLEEADEELETTSKVENSDDHKQTSNGSNT